MSRIFKKQPTLTLLALLIVSQLAFAQKSTIEIKGKVTDSKGEALAGAVVLVKGTANGAMTADDGTYSLKAEKNAVLEASLLGYATQEQPVVARTVVDFVLKDDSVMLQEAVIEVGYGEQRLVDLTGTVSRVNIEELEKSPVISIDQALQGRVAGMSVTTSDGQPGATVDIVIRGSNSLTQSSAPLYVVDGFPLEDFNTSMLNPTDIASITVLKDASSTAIYGSRGANGVIVIETKKGKLGKPQISYSGTAQLHQASKRMELMSPYDFVLYQIERNSSAFDKYLTTPGRTLDYYLNEYNGIDWQDRLFRNAFAQTHSISVMGGNSDTRYSVSGSAVSQDGVIVNSGYQRYQGRFALEQKLAKNLRMIINGSYTEQITSGQTSSAMLSSSNSYSTYLMYRTWAFRPVSIVEADDESLTDEDDAGSAALFNPVISNMNEQNTKKQTTFVANAKLEWNITKTLKFTVRGGYDNRIIRDEEFNNSKTVKGFSRVTNNLGVNGSFSEQKKTNWMNENILSYNHTFAKKHKVGAMGGFSLSGITSAKYGFVASQIEDEAMGLSGLDTGIPYSISSTKGASTMMSVFGRLNYGYDNRYLFTATIRGDGSSRFAEGHRWGFFPSAAFAWRLGQEKWMKDIRWIEDAKIRASYGSTGNNKVGDYSSYATLSYSDYYPFGNVPAIAVLQNAIGNKDLTWETTDQYDLGIDLRLFESRLNITADVYDKVTRNLLLNAKVPYSSGFTTAYKNVGKIQNAGLELSVNSVNVRTRDFLWTTDFNISFNRDKVLELAEGQETLLTAVSFTGDFNGTNLYVAQLGGPVASFYGMVWDGCYKVSDFDYNPLSGKYTLKPEVPTNGDDRATIQPGDIKYVDQNGDGIVNDLDQVVIGRCAPIHTGGFNNTFTWRDLSLNVFFTWSYGNQIMNANRIFFEGNYGEKNINQFASYNDHWTFENQESRNFRPGGQGPRGIYSTRTIEDGSFLRLKTLQLIYKLPRFFVRKFGMQSAQVSVSGQNLWTLCRYSGLDPEVSTRHSTLTPGFDYSAYARNRVFTLGLNVTF